ncbi:MAG: chromate transporter [Clostridia bacterium]|nr:chromate transporter [Clostridia bacterium]
MVKKPKETIVKKKNLLLDLFLTFAKIGLFTFGGGYAMISVIEDICVEKKKWISHEDMMDVIVVAESTPGPIAINCATFVGFQQAGLIGSICTTIGIVLPSFVIIFLISLFLDSFLEITLIANAFRGIQICVGLLILDAGITMIKKMKKKPLTIAIVAVTALVMLLINFLSLRFSSIALMLIAGAVSLGVYLLQQKGGKKA